MQVYSDSEHQPRHLIDTTLVDRERVATLELINKAGLPSEEVSYLSNLVRKAAGRLPQHQYGVITKESILTLLPKGETLETCIKECTIETARAIGAHWLVTGELIKFGGELRVSLSLHHSASGELRASNTLKGRDVKELESGLQVTALGLFAAIDPSLSRLVERLKRGFVFEKVTFGALPTLPTLEPMSTQAALGPEKPLPIVKLPSAVNTKGVQGINFGSIDIDALAAYDEALKADEKIDISPKKKIKLWRKAKKLIPKIKTLADQRIKLWREFLIKSERIKAEQEKRRKEHSKRKEARKKERDRRREKVLLFKIKLLQDLKKIKEEDAKQEVMRRVAMKRDWKKLSRLLPMRVVTQDDKLNWVDAFLDSYGVIKTINPYIQHKSLAPYLNQLRSRVKLYRKENQITLAHRERFFYEIELKRCEIETGVMGELCLKKRARAKKRELKRTGGVEFAVIPAGEFKMGSNRRTLDDEEKPVHKVKVYAFMMSKTEITVAQYRKCVEAGACTKPYSNPEIQTDRLNCNWIKINRDHHPVNCVHWGQARDFAKWVGWEFDLPTEAEWEYAALGGEDYKYAGSNDPDEVAWYRHSKGISSYMTTHPVGLKKPNSYGLYDMSGNVKEWVLDKRHHSYRGAPTQSHIPRGGLPSYSGHCPASDRISRGGDWTSETFDLNVRFRGIHRANVYHLTKNGFRIRRLLTRIELASQ